MSRPDAVHEPGKPGTAWSTTNAAENFPGVATPLGWTFWREGIERGMRGAFADLGVLRESEVVFPPSADERFTSVFFGRYSGNVDRMRLVSDLMPGTSGSETELQIFGSVRPEVPDHPSARRYPAIARKLPRSLLRSSRRLRAQRAAVDAWWRRETTLGSARPDPQLVELLQTARARFEWIMRPHIFASMIASAAYSRLAGVTEAAGCPGLETALVSGYGGLEEAATVADLWAASRDRLSVEAFLGWHGYHAPVEAEIRTLSWREDPTPVRQRVASFARRPDDASPERQFARQAEIRRTAERTLLAGVPRVQRPATRALLAFAARSVPLREVGKAGFLQSIDVGRLAARELGHRWAHRGAIDTTDDIFFLTLAEVAGGLPVRAREIVAQRRATHRHYEQLRLPDFWLGVPDPEQPAVVVQPGQAASQVKGIPVSPGNIEGIARVMAGPDSGDLDDGEILVCATTDPSWAALFFVAGAVVIDIGGPMSHGAIVAREMGIPCVINTRNGTIAIHTGDHIRVDGTTGEVTILDRVAA